MAQPVCLLYITGETVASDSLERKFAELRYRVDRLSTVPADLSQLQALAPQVVVLDQTASNETDLESVRRLIEAFKRTAPLIIVLNSGQEERVAEMLNLGIDDYLIADSAQGYLALVEIVIDRALARQKLTEQQELAEAAIAENLAGIERAKQEWEATIDSLPQLICLLDRHGQIIRANLTVELWQLAPVTGIRGQNLQDLLQIGEQWPTAWEQLSAGHSVEFQYYDSELSRYILLQARPLSTQTSRRDKLLGSFAAVVAEDVSQRKAAEESLRQYAQQLEAHNQDLDAFAHTVAHDLQNPLGLVMGFSSALGKHYERLSPEEVSVYLRKIMETSRKMSNIIKELLLLASVRQQDVELEPLDMNRLLQEARRRLSVLIEDHQAELILPDHWPIALGYAPWIEEVWVNYISNALKYGGQPPYLTFGANMESTGMIQFWIQDNGPGLTPEEQDQLFQPFMRLHKQQIQGHGLGLSIVQRIVTKLGGRVAVESEGVPGRGTTFSFTLPSPEYSILTKIYGQ